MVKISELNKKERELKNTLENLKRDYRKNHISKNDYDRAVDEHKKGLSKIGEEKTKLIGKPPIPPAPSKSPLSDIKRGIMADKATKPFAKPAVKPVADKVPKPPPKPVDKPVLSKPAPKPDVKPFAEKPAMKPAPKPIAEKPAAKPSVKPIADNVPKPPARRAAPKAITVKEPPKSPEPLPSAEDSQTRISRALKRMSDMDTETIKKVFEETQKEFLTFLVEVKKNREKIQNLENLFSEVNDIRKRFNAMDFKGMTDEIYRQFERMNSVVKENESKIEELVSRDESRIGALEKRVGEVSASLTSIPAVDDAKRELESLKQKVEWLEKSRQEVDVQPVMDMVKALEEKLESLKVSSPYIIE